MIWQIAPLALFILFIVAALYVDMAVLHIKEREIPISLALKMTVFWIAVALVFCVGVYFVKGQEKALMFLTGFLIEKSLSLDNLFVFILIFSYLQVPAKYQPKVLFLGILGAIVMRLVFILAGITLLQMFHWMIYVFGVFLILTGLKLIMQGDVKVHPEKNPVLKLFKRIMPVETAFHGNRFFIKKEEKYYATPLFVTVILIETSDIVFAVDSIPAIMAITLDPFIVYTSNIFAILGLRALYFALMGIMKMFHYLNYGLSLILVFLGIKMTISNLYKVPVMYSLGLIACTLLTCITLSMVFPPKEVKNRT